MAGSGKTTFLQRLNAHLHEKQLPGYIINLDPAVRWGALAASKAA
jgi:GTPase SAR1 family protein